MQAPRLALLKRLFDLCAGLCALVLLLLPGFLLCALVALTSKGPVFYWSDRVGQHNRIFRMPKFRTMKMGTPAVATHLLSNPQAHLTPIGGFLPNRRRHLWFLGFCGCLFLAKMKPSHI